MDARPPRSGSGRMGRTAGAGRHWRCAPGRRLGGARPAWPRCFRPGCGGAPAWRQDGRGWEPQHPEQRAKRPGHRRRRGCDQRRHLRVPQQVVELRAIAHRLRHQGQQPAECLRQRIFAALFPGDGFAAGDGSSRTICALAEAGGETRETLVDVAEAAEDERDHWGSEPVPGATENHGLHQPAEDGGEAFGRGVGWGDGHGRMLEKMT